MPSRSRSIRTAFLAAGASVAAAISPGPGDAAAEAHDPARLVTLPFAARNLGPQPMACMAETAHFYSVDIGTASRGSEIAHAFRAAPGTGEIFVSNARGDLMPVQALWCGIAGRAWVTRFAVPLPRRAGQRPSPLRFACRSDGVALRCDAFRPQAGPGTRDTTRFPKRELD